jgi:hypothetical protein
MDLFLKRFRLLFYSFFLGIVHSWNMTWERFLLMPGFSLKLRALRRSTTEGTTDQHVQNLSPIYNQKTAKEVLDPAILGGI